jgi:general stress protein 26
MEPFPPDTEWIIWMGTNRLSRKVKEIRHNPNASIHYFSKSAPGYVNLYGKAYLIDNSRMKDSIWRKSWEDFYPDKSNYILIKFVPDSLEMIYPAKNLPGDSLTWRPYRIILRK